MLTKKTVVILPALLAGATLVSGPAVATSPVGACPDDYTAMTKSDVRKLPDADLALAVFDVVNANGDRLVCYKPYPNGPHNGHYGNFVDNTAAPHE